MAIREFYTDEEKGRIVNMRMQGMGPKEIGKNLGMKATSISKILAAYKNKHNVTYPDLPISKKTGSRKAKHTYQIGQVVKVRSHGEIVVGEIMPITANYSTALILKLDEKQCSETLFKDHLGVVPVNRNEVLEVME